MRGLRAQLYLFSEVLPTFLLGVVVFVSILLMFQILRLTEFVLGHGVSVRVIGELMGYLAVSFMPVILPMSLLFSILITYGRLSSDSEIVALKSCGLSLKHIGAPAIFLAILISIVSAQVSFRLAPWGNRQFELMISRIGQSKIGTTIREGVFSEGFFNLVVYANKVDSKTGLLDDVFLYDERDPKLPITIIAKQGVLVKDPLNPQRNSLIRLANGNIHRTSPETYTKVDFTSYDIKLDDPSVQEDRQKSILSLSIDEIQRQLTLPETPLLRRNHLEVELHKRWALALACIFFAIIGIGLGTTTNRRNIRSSGMVLSLGLIVVYWAIYIASENLAKKGVVVPWLAVWAPNTLFLCLGVWSLRRSS